MGKNSKCTPTFPVSSAVQNSVRAMQCYCKKSNNVRYLAESLCAAGAA